MGRKPEQILFQRQHTGGQWAHENVLNISNHQRKANQNLKIELASSKRTQVTNVGEDVEKRGTPVHCCWECKLVQSLWKTVWRLLKKLKIDLPYNSAIPLLGIYRKKMKTLI